MFTSSSVGRVSGAEVVTPPSPATVVGASGGRVLGGATVALGPDTWVLSSPAGLKVVAGSVGVLTVVGTATGGRGSIVTGSVKAGLSWTVKLREGAAGGSVGLVVAFEGPCKEETLVNVNYSTFENISVYKCLDGRSLYL